MGKIFGWILIALLILATLLPIWPYPYALYTIGGGEVTITKYTWWILSIPDNQGSVIFGEIIGYIGFWILGIWLVKRKRKEHEETKVDEKVEIEGN